MKKKLLVILSAVLGAILLVTGSIAGTIAYLTSQDSVTNTFTVGKVTITMDEAKTDLYGVKDGTTREEDGNEYKLIPNHTYVKDPTIYVEANSEDCYVFVKVENGISAIEATDNTIAAQMAANGWTVLSGNVYVLKGKNGADENGVVASSASKITIPVFASFTVDKDAEADEVADYADAKIIVTAYAVQADGFNGVIADAWAALVEAYPPAP